MKYKHEMFCQEYLCDLNAKHAAIRAGYSEHSARWTGPRLLKRWDVKVKIEDLRKEMIERYNRRCRGEIL